MSAFQRALGSASWPRSTADLAAIGVKHSTTRGKKWRQTSRGFFVPAGLPESTTQRVLEATPLVPEGGALAGWAAAYVLGVDCLDGRDPHTMSPLPITISLGRDSGRLDTDRLRYVRDRLPTSSRMMRHGISVTTPERTAFDGARWAPSLVEAVVFLDQITHALPIDLAALSNWCAPGGRWPGIDQLRQALPLAEPASASPWESRLRMFYTHQAKLPRPGVNKAIFSPDGDLLGIADLFDPEAGLVTEFDGQDHRKRAQHRADNLREERLEEANLMVCRVDSLDLRYTRPLVERLRARHSQGMQRDRRRDGWTLTPPPWWRHRIAS